MTGKFYLIIFIRNNLPKEMRKTAVEGALRVATLHGEKGEMPSAGLVCVECRDFEGVETAKV
jgi:hypothetical protein